MACFLNFCKFPLHCLFLSAVVLLPFCLSFVPCRLCVWPSTILGLLTTFCFFSYFCFINEITCNIMYYIEYLSFLVSHVEINFKEKFTSFFSFWFRTAQQNYRLTVLQLFTFLSAWWLNTLVHMNVVIADVPILI